MTSATQSSTTSIGRAAPPPPPSHAHFILAQIRSGLAHLRATRALKRSTCDQINDLINQDELQEGETTHSSVTSKETEEERLGKRNAWLRETLMETSLLPTLVETAMQIAIPSAIMGDMQREAVIQLVERSQRSIAETVTNPKMQRKAGSGAWSGVRGTHTGIRRGWNAAGNSIQEMAQRRQEAKEKSEEKKAEKNEKKAMKKELKREREAIVKQRQTNMLSDSVQDDNSEQHQPDSSHRGMDRLTSAANLVHSPSALTAASESSSLSRRLPPLSSSKGTQSTKEKTIEENDSDESDDDDSEAEGQDVFSAEDGAMVSVSCGRVDDEENCVSATTFFSPWPGLVLSNTMVALSNEVLPGAMDIERIRYDQAMENGRKQSAMSNPPQRRVAPAPLTSQSANQAKSERQVRDSESNASQIPAHQNTSISNQTPHVPPKDSSSRQTEQNPPSTRPAPQPSSYNANSTSHSDQPAQSSVSQNRSSPHPTQPAPPVPPQQPQRTEVRDVTEAKQKSWTRKLGL